MWNLCGHQYSCSFAGERRDVSFLFDAVPGPVSAGLRPVKDFGGLAGACRPEAKLQQVAYEECGSDTLVVSSLTNSKYDSEERISLW